MSCIKLREARQTGDDDEKLHHFFPSMKECANMSHQEDETEAIREMSIQDNPDKIAIVKTAKKKWTGEETPNQKNNLEWAHNNDLNDLEPRKCKVLKKCKSVNMKMSETLTSISSSSFFLQNRPSSYTVQHRKCVSLVSPP